MSSTDVKAELHRYLIEAREALRRKADGLSEYDLRRPLTPTGTNLLGLIKHVASVAAGYFGPVFDRPSEPLPWLEADAEPNADLFATADESQAEIFALWDRCWTRADATIEALALGDLGQVPWWQEDRQSVTLGQILVHMLAETSRHAGQADIVRELVDGAVVRQSAHNNLPDVDPDWWPLYRARLERIAAAFDE